MNLVNDIKNIITNSIELSLPGLDADNNRKANRTTEEEGRKKNIVMYVRHADV